MQSHRLILGLPLTAGVPNLSLTMYPFSFQQLSMYPYSISTDKHVPLQNFDR